MRRHRRSAAPDESVRDILIIGPWQHREITANGIRFHLATGSGFSRDRPLVLLLHGFGEFWWAWRHQLPALDAAGLSVAAVDLRGYGATDKTPRGYRQSVTGSDISGVVRSLGFETATVVGHDWGGIAAWSTYAYAPEQVTALAVIGAPHPLRFPWRSMGPSLAWFQLPILPERVIMARQGAYVEWLLHRRAGTGAGFDDHGGLALPAGARALAEPPLCPGVPADVRPRSAAHRGTRLPTSTADRRRRAGAHRPRVV
jgi:pimeloyl-ACP methyl ester carboxylesterase